MWSCFLAEVHELFGVATQLLKDVSLSLTLSPSEEFRASKTVVFGGLLILLLFLSTFICKILRN